MPHTQQGARTDAANINSSAAPRKREKDDRSAVHAPSYFSGLRVIETWYEPAHLSRRRHRRAQHPVDLRSYCIFQLCLYHYCSPPEPPPRQQQCTCESAAGQGAVLTGTATTSSSILISKRHGDALAVPPSIVDARSTAVDGGATHLDGGLHYRRKLSPRLEFADTPATRLHRKPRPARAPHPRLRRNERAHA